MKKAELRKSEECFALSVRQPYASSIMFGEKTKEFRSWAPPEKIIGKKLYIHSSASAWKPEDPIDLEEYLQGRECDQIFPRGMLLGTVIVDGFVEEDGRFAWKLSSPKCAKKLVAAKGKLGLWLLDAAQKKALKFPKSRRIAGS